MGNQRAFSLWEIIIAIAIIVIFTVLPVLAYTNYIKKARDDKRKADISKISAALESYKAEKGVYPTTLDDLVTSGFLPELPVDPKDGEIYNASTGGTYGYKYTTDGGTSFTLSAPLEGGGSGGGGGSGEQLVYVVEPGGSGTMPETTITARKENPTAPPPSKTPVLSATVRPSVTLTPTRTPTPTPTPPPCDATIVCSGACQAISGRCGTYASTQPGCEYTTKSGFATCQEVPVADQACTYSGAATCSGQFTCVATNCVQNCNTTVSCSGSCATVANKCAPNSYASTRSGCTYTAHTNGQSCASVAAPDQACSVTSQACGGGLPQCETSTSTCRQCLTNTHCTTNANSRCSSYTCSPCITNADCSHRSPNTVCSSGTCVTPVPTTTPAASTYSYALLGNAGNSIIPHRVRSANGNGMVMVGRYGQGSSWGYFIQYFANNPVSGSWRDAFKYTANPASIGYSDVVQTSDDGFAAVGSITFSSASSRSGILVRKYSSSGAVQWTSVYGAGSGSGRTNGYGITQLSNGNLAITGESNAFSNPSNVRHEKYVLVLDSSGTKVWDKIYSYENVTNGIDMGQNQSVYQAADGTIITFGEFSDFEIMKVNATTGAPVSLNRIGTANFEGIEGVAKIPGGGYIISGYFNSGCCTSDWGALRIDENSNIAWSRSFYNPRILETDGSNFYYSLVTNLGWGIVAKTNSALSSTWSKTYNMPAGNVDVSSIGTAVMPDGGMAGVFIYSSDYTQRHTRIIRTNSSGTGVCSPADGGNTTMNAYALTGPTSQAGLTAYDTNISLQSVTLTTETVGGLMGGACY